ncbi:MAG: hypothetical protein ACLGJC_09515 [Alphaproteobacteria bacterium]
MKPRACPYNPFMPGMWSPTLAQVDAHAKHAWKTPQMTPEERKRYRRLCEEHGAIEARRIMFADGTLA